MVRESLKKNNYICSLTVFGLINCRTQLICGVRQLIKPNIVYKDTTGMTNHMFID